MTFSIKEKLVVAGKYLAFILWFAFFASIVRPEIGSRVIPKLIDFSETYAESQKGIDLDPIVLPSTGDTTQTRSSLYSTRTTYDASIYGDLVTSDTRVVAMSRFLTDYNSPMAPYAETFVAAADKGGMDWRLVASISGVESAFGKLIPHNSYNGWGWKGDPNRDFSVFPSWGVGIETVTAGLARGYKGMTPYDMEGIYCPPCGATGRHEWANGVSGYMNQLDQYRKSL